MTLTEQWGFLQHTSQWEQGGFPLPVPLQIHDNFVPWASAVRCLSLVLDSQLLYTQHLHAVANKATAVLCNIFPLLARDSTLTQSIKLTLYK